LILRVGGRECDSIVARRQYISSVWLLPVVAFEVSVAGRSLVSVLLASFFDRFKSWWVGVALMTALCTHLKMTEFLGCLFLFTERREVLFILKLGTPLRFLTDLFVVVAFHCHLRRDIFPELRIEVYEVLHDLKHVEKFVNRQD